MAAASQASLPPHAKKAMKQRDAFVVPIESVENELGARDRLMCSALKERERWMAIRADRSKMNERGAILFPFGLQFHVDHEQIEREQEYQRRKKFASVVRRIAALHHKLGIRHLILIALMTLYVLGGGLLFYQLERQNELNEINRTLEAMDMAVDLQRDAIVNITELFANDTAKRDELIREQLQEFYRTMLQTEDRFRGSIWHKAENLNLNLIWYYSSSTFYAMTLFTTIGYGTIACTTTWGRVLSIIYALIGIPLMLVVLGDIGELFNRGCTGLYAKTRDLISRKQRNKDERVILPISLAICIVLAYLMLCALIISFFDHDVESDQGIGFFSSFYFVVISLTTIGLGDVMPFHIHYSPWVALLFLLGLALFSIVNTSIYARVEKVAVGGMTKMEAHLEHVHSSRQGIPGHWTFLALSPAFRTIVLSFPRAEENPFNAPERRDSIATVAESIAESVASSEQPEASIRAPVLGVFGGHHL